MKIQTGDLSGADVTKRAFFLAYEACGGPLGMGWLQARDGVGEEDVWKNVAEAGDYPYPGGDLFSRPGQAYGDYVFGRMMKLGIGYGPDWVEAREDKPRIDYQSWCSKYPTYEALIRAAITSLQTVAK